ncbi:MAG: hypothetical protein ACI9OJ_003425 [Myxococcota bacterium]|jgi:hypothetical protein
MWDNAGFSGILGQGSITGIARLGWGAPPLAGYIPGMGLKFFVDGRSSLNLHLIHELDPSKEANFFAVPLGHNLPTPRNSAIAALAFYFGLFVDNPLYLRVDHIGRVNQAGEETDEDQRNVPYQLIFSPSDAISARYADSLATDPRADFRDIFSTFDVGTVLYEVHAQAEKDGCTARIGTLRCTSRFITSAWGDERLHFQHATDGQGLD